MGFKTRDAKRTLRRAVLELLQPSVRLSQRQILSALRKLPKTPVSVSALQDALARLIEDGRVVMEGSRARARFRRAVAIGAKVGARAARAKRA